MAEIASAFVSLIPSAKGFGAKTSAELAPHLAVAGKTGGIGMMKGMAAGVTVGIGAVVAATKGLYEVGQRFEEMRKTIIVGTGASGKALEGLEETARNIAKQTPASFDQIGTAVAGLRSRMGLTGKPLEEMSLQMIRLTRLTGTDLSSNIADLTRLFGDWSVPAEKQSKVLDEVFRASQKTGVGINEIAKAVVFSGAPLRQFGFTLEQGLAMFGKWEKEGVNTRTVLSGLKIGLGAFSKAGKNPVKALAEVSKAIKNAGSVGEANQIAIKTFGQRAGPDMAAAVREGRFELDSLTKQIKNGGGSIKDAADRTKTFSSVWGTFKNNVLVAMQPLATKVFDTFTQGFITVIPKMSAGVGQLGGVLSKVTSGFDSGKVVSQFGSSLSEVGTSVQAKLLPALQTFATAVMPTVIEQGKKIGDALGPAFQQISDVVAGQLVPAIAGMMPILAPVAKFLLAMFGGAVIGAIHGVVNVITGVVTAISGVLNLVSDLIHGRWGQLWGDFKQIVSGVVTAIKGIIQVWWNVGILSMFKRGFVFLTKGIWQRGWMLLKGAAEGALRGVVAAIRGGLAALGRVLMGAVRGYFGIWKGLFGFLRAVAVNGWRVLRSAFGGALAAIRTVVGHVLSGIAGTFRSALGAARNAVSTGLGKVVTLFRELPGKVVKGIGDLSGKLLGVGQDIVRGLINGIRGMAGDVTRTLVGLLPGPLKKFAGKLGIGSPSKVFHKFGQNVGEGFRNGLDSQGKKVSDSVGKLADKVHKKAIAKLKKLVDALKQKASDAGSVLADLQSKAADIVNNVTSAFSPDLFSGTLGDLIGGVTSGIANVQTALAGLPKLMAAGIGGDFLQQLMASGNATLIGQLAANPAQAQALQAQYNTLQNLTGQLGQQVANQATSADIAAATAQLVLINKQLAVADQKYAKATGHALNKTAAAAKRRKKAKAKAGAH